MYYLLICKLTQICDDIVLHFYKAIIFLGLIRVVNIYNEESLKCI